MATRTVRLDAEAEAALREIRETTGLPISEALKRGLRSLQERVKDDTVYPSVPAMNSLGVGERSRPPRLPAR